jgi:hypothetical protein
MCESTCSDYVIFLSIANVSKTFKQVNIRKAAGQDGIPGHVLSKWEDKSEMSSLTFSTYPWSGL